MYKYICVNRVNETTLKAYMSQCLSYIASEAVTQLFYSFVSPYVCDITSVTEALYGEL